MQRNSFLEINREEPRAAAAIVAAAEATLRQITWACRRAAFAALTTPTDTRWSVWCGRPWSLAAMGRPEKFQAFRILIRKQIRFRLLLKPKRYPPCRGRDFRYMRFSLVVLAVLATFMTGCISSVVKEAVKPYEKELEKYRSTPKITNSLIISRTYWPGLEFRPVSKRISITADGFLRYSTMESWKQKTFETKKEIQLSNNQLLDLIKIFYENFIDLREKYHLPTTDSPSYEYYFKDDFTEKKVTVTGGHPFPEELNIINKVLNELLDKIADGQ